jgi:hypothetical protein
MAAGEFRPESAGEEFEEGIRPAAACLGFECGRSVVADPAIPRTPIGGAVADADQQQRFCLACPHRLLVGGDGNAELVVAVEEDNGRPGTGSGGRFDVDMVSGAVLRSGKLKGGWLGLWRNGHGAIAEGGMWKAGTGV